MLRYATGFVAGFLLSTSLAFAAFTPKGVTHHNLIGVTETISPCAVRDRPIIEFTDADGNLMVVTWIDASKSLSVVTAATCATLATTSTTATTTTVTTTTNTTTTT
jgi:hypothetical protein